jgi:uroporphyrinogen decarboxylase
LSPRERVLTALNHKEPDKFPIGLGATNVTAPTRLANVAARAYWGLPPDPAPRVADRAMDAVYPMENFYRKCEVDFRPVTLKPPRISCYGRCPMTAFTSSSLCGGRRRSTTTTWSSARWPPRRWTLDKAVWPDPYDPGRVAGLAQETKRQYETTEYALVADIMCMGPFEGDPRTRSLAMWTFGTGRACSTCGEGMPIVRLRRTYAFEQPSCNHHGSRSRHR